MEIKENLTNVNYNKLTNKVNKYIVIHYVGAISTAYNNSVYFKSVNRNASANYFVDDNEIYRVVKDEDKAWHCGDSLKTGNGGKYNGKCTNSNSIGIEMCCYDNNGKLDISEKTIENTIQLVKELMAKYNIPVENVIRHYDVTNKNCPAPFVENESRWIDFKARLGQVVDKNTDDCGQSTSTNYTVKINTTDLNVRDGAGTNYKVNTVVHKNEVYTIVEERTNGTTKWGKLKSGAGWISLGYTVKVNSSNTLQDSSQYYQTCNSKYTSIVDALNSINVNSSFDNRKKIAQKNNVNNYTGTAIQNNQLLDKLKAGKLRK